MEDNKNLFPQGMWLNSPPENAPEFIKAKIDIEVSEFCKWLQKNEDEKGKVHLDILKSKEGKNYLKLNTWKPKEQSEF
jgi:hypothetical protein